EAMVTLERGQRLVARDAASRHHSNADRDGRPAAQRADCFEPVDSLVRRERDRHEIVRVVQEAAAVRALVERADDGESLRADPDGLADRIETGVLEELLERRVADDADVRPVLQLGAVEVAAGPERNAR